MLKKDEKTYVLCNGVTCSCPEVIINKEKNEVKIIDDFGQQVKMTLEQFKEIKKVINEM